MIHNESARQRAGSTRRVPSSVLIESWGGAAAATAVGASLGVRNHSSHHPRHHHAGSSGSTASSSSSAGIIFSPSALPAAPAASQPMTHLHQQQHQSPSSISSPLFHLPLGPGTPQQQHHHHPSSHPAATINYPHPSHHRTGSGHLHSPARHLQQVSSSSHLHSRTAASGVPLTLVSSSGHSGAALSGRRSPGGGVFAALPPTGPPSPAVNITVGLRSRSASKLSSSGSHTSGIDGGHPRHGDMSGSNSTATAAAPLTAACGGGGGGGGGSSSGSYYLAQHFQHGGSSSGRGGTEQQQQQQLQPQSQQQQQQQHQLLSFAPTFTTDGHHSSSCGSGSLPPASNGAGAAGDVVLSVDAGCSSRANTPVGGAGASTTTAAPAKSSSSASTIDVVGNSTGIQDQSEGSNVWGARSTEARMLAPTRTEASAFPNPHSPSETPSPALRGSTASTAAPVDASGQPEGRDDPVSRATHSTVIVSPPGVAPGIAVTRSSTSSAPAVFTTVVGAANLTPSSSMEMTTGRQGGEATGSSSYESTGSGFIEAFRRKLPFRPRDDGEAAGNARGSVEHSREDGSYFLDGSSHSATGMAGGSGGSGSGPPGQHRSSNSTASPGPSSSPPSSRNTRGNNTGVAGPSRGGLFGAPTGAANNNNNNNDDDLLFSDEKGGNPDVTGANAGDDGDESGRSKTPCTLGLGTVLRGVVVFGFVVAIISAFTPVYIKGREANTELMVHLREQTIYRTAEQLKYRFQVATDAVYAYATAAALTTPFAGPVLTVPPELNGTAATMIAGVTARVNLVTYMCMMDNAIGTTTLLYCDPSWNANSTTATAAPAAPLQNITSSVAASGVIVQDVGRRTVLCTMQIESNGAWDYFVTSPLFRAPTDVTARNSSWINTTFDARTRPWFIAGSARVSPTWTEIYMDVRGFAVVTAVAPIVDLITNKHLGAVAADFSSTDIALYMTPLQVSANGRSILLDYDTRTIWGTNFEQQDLYHNANGTQRLARWRDVTDPLLKRVRDSLGEDWPFQGVGLRSLTIGDGAFHRSAVAVDVTDIRDDFGLNMRLLIAIPESDFAKVMWDGAILAISVTCGVGFAILVLVVLVLSGVSAALARVVDSLYAAAYLDVGGPSEEHDGRDANADEPLSTHPFARWIEEIVRIDGAFGVLRAELAQIKGFLPAHIIAASEARTNNTSDLASSPHPAEGRGGGGGADRASVASTIMRGRIGRGGLGDSASAGNDDTDGGVVWVPSMGSNSVRSDFSAATAASQGLKPSSRRQRPHNALGVSFATGASASTTADVTRSASAATYAFEGDARPGNSDVSDEEGGSSTSVAAAAAAAASQQLQLQQQRAHSLLVAPQAGGGGGGSGGGSPGGPSGLNLNALSRGNSPSVSFPFDMSVLRQAGLQLGFGGGRLSARRVTVAAVNLWRFCASAAAFAAAEGDESGAGGSGPGGSSGNGGKSKRLSRRTGPQSAGVGSNAASAHQRQLATLDSVRAAHFIAMRTVEAAATATTGSLDSFVGDLIWVSWNAATTCVSHRERAIEFLARLSADADGDRYTTAGASTSLAYLGVLGTQRVKRFAIVGPCTGQALYLERMCSRYPLAAQSLLCHTANTAAHLPPASVSLNASSSPQLQRHLGVSAGGVSDGRSEASAGAAALSQSHYHLHPNNGGTNGGIPGTGAVVTPQPVMRVANLISGTMLDGAPADLMAVPVDALHLPTGSYAHAETVLPRQTHMSSSQLGHPLGVHTPAESLWPLQEKRSPLATVLPWVVQPARGGTMGAGGVGRLPFHATDDPMTALWVDATSNAAGRLNAQGDVMRSGRGQSLRDDASARMYAAMGELDMMSDGPVYGDATSSPSIGYHRLAPSSGVVTGGPLTLPSATLTGGLAGGQRATSSDMYRYALASLVDGYFCLCRNETDAARTCLQRAQDRFSNFLPLASVAIDPDTTTPVLPVEPDMLGNNRDPSSGDYTSGSVTPTRGGAATANGIGNAASNFVIDDNFSDAERKALVRALHLLQRGMQRLCDTLEAHSAEQRRMAVEVEAVRATQRARMGLASTTGSLLPRAVVPPPQLSTRSTASGGAAHHMAYHHQQQQQQQAQQQQQHQYYASSSGFGGPPGLLSPSFSPSSPSVLPAFLQPSRDSAADGVELVLPPVPANGAGARGTFPAVATLQLPTAAQGPHDEQQQHRPRPNGHKDNEAGFVAPPPLVAVVGPPGPSLKPPGSSAAARSTPSSVPPHPQQPQSPQVWMTPPMAAAAAAAATTAGTTPATGETALSAAMATSGPHANSSTALPLAPTTSSSSFLLSYHPAAATSSPINVQSQMGQNSLSRGSSAPAPPSLPLPLPPPRIIHPSVAAAARCGQQHHPNQLIDEREGVERDVATLGSTSATLDATATSVLGLQINGISSVSQTPQPPSLPPSAHRQSPLVPVGAAAPSGGPTNPAAARQSDDATSGGTDGAGQKVVPVVGGGVFEEALVITTASLPGNTTAAHVVSNTADRHRGGGHETPAAFSMAFLNGSEVVLGAAATTPSGAAAAAGVSTATVFSGPFMGTGTVLNATAATAAYHQQTSTGNTMGTTTTATGTSSVSSISVTGTNGAVDVGGGGERSASRSAVTATVATVAVDPSSDSLGNMKPLPAPIGSVPDDASPLPTRPHADLPFHVVLPTNSNRPGTTLTPSLVAHAHVATPTQQQRQRQHHLGPLFEHPPPTDDLAKAHNAATIDGGGTGAATPPLDSISVRGGDGGRGSSIGVTSSTVTRGDSPPSTPSPPSAVGNGSGAPLSSAAHDYQRPHPRLAAVTAAPLVMTATTTPTRRHGGNNVCMDPAAGTGGATPARGASGGGALVGASSGTPAGSRRPLMPAVPTIVFPTITGPGAGGGSEAALAPTKHSTE